MTQPPKPPKPPSAGSPGKPTPDFAVLTPQPPEDEMLTEFVRPRSLYLRVLAGNRAESALYVRTVFSLPFTFPKKPQ